MAKKNEKTASAQNGNLEVRMVSIQELTPYEHNARRHPEDQLQQLEDSIRSFGFTNPILAASDGVVVAGHGRLEAAKRLEMTHVPVIFLELSELERRAYTIADNKIGLNAVWDLDVLAREVNEIAQAYEAQGMDINDFSSSLGFMDSDELDNLLQSLNTSGDGEEEPKAQKKSKEPERPGLYLEFDTEDQKSSLIAFIERLKETYGEDEESGTLLALHAEGVLSDG